MSSGRVSRGLRVVAFLFVVLAVVVSPVLPPPGAARAVALDGPVPDATASNGRSPALVVLRTTGLSSFEQALDAARANGAEVSLAYPPDAFIAELTPRAGAALRASPSVARVEKGVLPADEVAALGTNGATAARAWNRVYMKVPDSADSGAAPGRAPGGTDAPVRLPPPQAQRSSQILGAASSAPSPTQTSAFMAGTIVASVVFVESTPAPANGTAYCKNASSLTEDWTDARKAQVLNEVSEGLAFWASRAQRPDPLTFVVEDLGAKLGKTAATYCEPISGPSSSDSYWVADALVSLGYANANPSNSNDTARIVANERRMANKADWGYLIFVVDSLNDSDGLFSDGGFAYAYLSGPYIVMTYDNDGWGIDRTNYVVAHETGHIFGALDEYASSGCTTADRWGYFSVANASCNSGGITTDLSIMGESNEQMAAGSDVSRSARDAIGWRNPTLGVGGKTVVDVVRTSTVALTPYPTDPTTDSTPTFSATGGNTAYPPSTACNTVGGVCYEYPQAANVAKVASAEWAYDNYLPTAEGVAADDGAFDEETEPYTFTPTSPVLDGTRAFRTRSINNFGHATAEAVDTLTIGGGGATNTPPTMPSVPTPGSGSSNVPVSTSLSWSGGDRDAGDTVTYQLYLGPGSLPTTAIWSGSSTTYTPPGGLTASTTYYWQVVATDSHGAKTAGPPWSFTTAAGPLACSAGQLLATYFNNATLAAPLAFQRCETPPAGYALKYNWGTGSPDARLSADNFSARWEGQFQFDAARYKFTVTADNGVRVWVDNAILIDKWSKATNSAYTTRKTLTAGLHTVRVEYVEKTGSAYVSLSWVKG